MPQVAKRLGVPEAYALARHGRLPVVRIGRYVRMRPADLDAFVEAHQDVPGAPQRRLAATDQRPAPATVATSLLPDGEPEMERAENMDAENERSVKRPLLIA